MPDSSIVLDMQTGRLAAIFGNATNMKIVEKLRYPSWLYIFIALSKLVSMAIMAAGIPGRIMVLGAANWKHRLLAACPERIQIAAWVAVAYRKKFGCWPNLFTPRNYNEMVQARKVWNRDSRLPLLSDKILVKDFIRHKLGEEWLIPTLWAGKSLPPAAERNWPIPFVIKANCGCGWNIFVRSEVDRNWAVIEQTCRHWMSTTYGKTWGEWLYRRIDPQILVEPFLGSDGNLLVDYKFWVFHGRVHFIHVMTGRETGLKITIFDRQWQRTPYRIGYPSDERERPQPRQLTKMIEAAEALAEGFSFVRIDMYEIDDKPYFGEMTFYPGSGFNRATPPEFERRLVQLWRGK